MISFGLAILPMRLAKFWLTQGEEKTARVYMTEAHYGYQLWGADGKVEDIEKRYPQLISPPTAKRNSMDILLDTTDPATSSEGRPNRETAREANGGT